MNRELKCIWCEKELKSTPAETINPFVTKGDIAICFRCIALLNTMAWNTAIHYLTIDMHSDSENKGIIIPDGKMSDKPENSTYT